MAICRSLSQNFSCSPGIAGNRRRFIPLGRDHHSGSKLLFLLLSLIRTKVAREEGCRGKENLFVKFQAFTKFFIVNCFLIAVSATIECIVRTFSFVSVTCDDELGGTQII
jgi:hypothetical protein